MNPADARVAPTLGDRITTVLMLVSALGVLYAFITSIGAVQTAGPATQQVETWRMFGFLMFAGVFILLGVWPRRLPGLWELTIANKVGLTIAEALLIRNSAAGAQFTAISGQHPERLPRRCVSAQSRLHRLATPAEALHTIAGGTRYTLASPH